MKEQEIIANLHRIIADNQQFTTWTVSTPHLVALVQYAIETEREACAKLCEELDIEYEAVCQMTSMMCSQAIRARGNT